MMGLGREPTVVAAIAIGLLAAMAVGMRPASVVHRALALFLLLRSLSLLLTSFANGIDDPVDRLWMYPAIAVPFAAANFAYVFWQDSIPPQRIHRRPTRAALRLGILAVGIAAEALYLLDHGLYLRADAAGNLNPGPLASITDVTIAAFAALALLFAWTFASAGPAFRRRSLLLAALGFALQPAFQAMFRLVTDLRSAQTFGLAPDLVTTLLFAGLALALVAAMLAVLLAAPGLDPRSRKHVARTVGVPVGAAALAGLAVANLAGALDPVVFLRTAFAADAFWQIALVLIALYAVLRYEFFGIELRVKIALRQSTVVAIIAGVFVVTSELLERIIPVEDAYIAVAVAVGIAFMMRRIQRVAEGVVERVMPDVNKGEAYLQRRRHEIYRAAIEDVMRDGLVKPQEAIMLDRLRDKLGIAVQEAHAIEAEAGVPGAPTGPAERWPDERLRGYS